LARSPIRTAFFAHSGKAAIWDERLLNPVVVDVLTAERMSCVLWNAIPGDWKEPDAWVDRALAQCRVQAWTVMVLHDLPTGAMRNLERFLDAVAELGAHARLRQDFEPECVPRWADRSADRRYSLADEHGLIRVGAERLLARRPQTRSAARTSMTRRSSLSLPKSQIRAYRW
jgi:hypothetical protein